MVVVRSGAPGIASARCASETRGSASARKRACSGRFSGNALSARLKPRATRRSVGVSTLYMQRSRAIATLTLLALACTPGRAPLEHALSLHAQSATRLPHHARVACPMPVARADSTVKRPMPVVDPGRGAIPMPFERAGCYNPIGPPLTPPLPPSRAPAPR